MNDQKFSNRAESPSKARHSPALALTELSRKTPNDQRGSDPYNTSGSFDRKKNWARVGKR